MNDRTKVVGDERRKGPFLGQSLNWEQLVGAEPRLASLLEEVREARPDDGDDFELEGIWGQFKDRIAGLVGWHRRHGDPFLQTHGAYKTAYKSS